MAFFVCAGIDVCAGSRPRCDFQAADNALGAIGQYILQLQVSDADIHNRKHISGEINKFRHEVFNSEDRRYRCACDFGGLYRVYKGGPPNIPGLPPYES